MSIGSFVGLVGREAPRRQMGVLVVVAAVALMQNSMIVGRQFLSTAGCNHVLQDNNPYVEEMLAEVGEDELHSYEMYHSPVARLLMRKGQLPLPFPQNEQGLHKLEFVHIPKTGGTSIEIAASRLGIAWGICKFEDRNRDSRCKPLRPFQHLLKMQNSSTHWQCELHASPWHCPPIKYKYGNKFENVDTFAVVRNPYDRMISEYYYFFADSSTRKYNRFLAPLARNASEVPDLNERDFMNQWISAAVRASKSEGHCYMGHCVPYYKFVFAKNGTKVVSHVLKMENLTEEFEALMGLYQLPIKLERHNVRVNNSTLGVEDLSAETRAKINKWAELDFELFGYEMLF